MHRVGLSGWWCSKARGVGYFLEGLLPLALFSKEPVTITLTGITNHELDLSVDVIRNVTLPLLYHFGIDEGLDFKVLRRLPLLMLCDSHCSCSVTPLLMLCRLSLLMLCDSLSVWDSVSPSASWLSLCLRPMLCHSVSPSASCAGTLYL